MKSESSVPNWPTKEKTHKGSLILTDTEPGDRPQHAEDGRTTHAAKLETGDGGARADRVPELRPPAGITVGSETAKAVWRRREGVVVGFSIQCIRVVEVEWRGWWQWQEK